MAYKRVLKSAEQVPRGGEGVRGRIEIMTKTNSLICQVGVTDLSKKGVEGGETHYSSEGMAKIERSDVEAEGGSSLTGAHPLPRPKRKGPRGLKSRNLSAITDEREG